MIHVRVIELVGIGQRGRVDLQAPLPDARPLVRLSAGRADVVLREPVVGDLPIGHLQHRVDVGPLRLQGRERAVALEPGRDRHVGIDIEAKVRRLPDERPGRGRASAPRDCHQQDGTEVKSTRISTAFPHRHSLTQDVDVVRQQVQRRQRGVRDASGSLDRETVLALRALRRPRGVDSFLGRTRTCRKSPSNPSAACPRNSRRGSGRRSPSRSEGGRCRS